MEVQKMKGNIKRIGLVLLTLLTLSLGTLVVNAETKDSDFVIENGVLKQYKGNDDTVYIPEGVTKIATYAFKNNEVGRNIGQNNIAVSENEMTDIIYQEIQSPMTRFIWLHE
jgi:hypothetical protein